MFSERDEIQDMKKLEDLNEVQGRNHTQITEAKGSSVNSPKN